MLLLSDNLLEYKRQNLLENSSTLHRQKNAPYFQQNDVLYVYRMKIDCKTELEQHLQTVVLHNKLLKVTNDDRYEHK